MDASCTIQEDIHVFSLIYKYVSRILGTYHFSEAILILKNSFILKLEKFNLFGMIVYFGNFNSFYTNTFK